MRPPAPAPPPPRPESPLTWTPPSPTACAGLYLATRDEPRGSPRAFLNRERALEAHARGEVRAADVVRIRGRVTTLGRFLVAECFPDAVVGNLPDAPWTAARVAGVLDRVLREVHVEVAARTAAALEQLGAHFAERSGYSLGVDDFAPPPARAPRLADARARVVEIEEAHLEGRITDGERFERTVGAWAACAGDELRSAARSTAPERDPLTVAAAAYPDAPAPERVRAMRGMVRAHADRTRAGAFERPVLHNAGDGFEPHEVMMLCRVARWDALARRELERAAAAALPGLHAVLGGVRVVTRDCGTREGMPVRRVPAGTDHDLGLGSRVEGRVLAADAVSPSGEPLARAGALLTPRLVERIDAARVLGVVVRDVQTCEARGGVCARCFGLDPDDLTWPAAGDAVGARAAFAIAGAMRNFARPWFHIC